MLLFKKAFIVTYCFYCPFVSSFTRPSRLSSVQDSGIGGVFNHVLHEQGGTVVSIKFPIVEQIQSGQFCFLMLILFVTQVVLVLLLCKALHSSLKFSCFRQPHVRDKRPRALCYPPISGLALNPPSFLTVILALKITSHSLLWVLAASVRVQPQRWGGLASRTEDQPPLLFTSLLSA